MLIFQKKLNEEEGARLMQLIETPKFNRAFYIEIEYIFIHRFLFSDMSLLVDFPRLSKQGNRNIYRII